jgi:glucose/arabinose dehydrogenase
VECLEERLTLSAPAAPVIIEPLTNGQVVSNFDVHMEVDPSAYSDADGDAHQSTTWQIRETAAAGGAVVWQAVGVTDALSKVHIHLGDGAFVGTLVGKSSLLASRDYALNATFTDSSNAVSATSVRTFSTPAPTAPVPGEGTWITHEGYAVEPAATAGAFRLPVNVAFVPIPGPNPTDPLYYVTELYGSIKMVTRGGQVSTYASGLLDYDPTGPISGTGEQGLAGLAIDGATGDLFVGMLWNNGTSDATRGGATVHYPKVERLHSTDGGKTMASRTILRNMQPETQGQSHQISNISIGPDGKLYVHMGDGFTATTALDLTKYRGKVLRMNLDGTAPADNPFYNAGDGITAKDFVYSYGHRNPFGGAWRASNGSHYVVENGNGLDRMVRIASGQSYGWDGNDSTLAANSIYVWNPAQAPVNIAFIQNQTFGGSLFPASSRDDAFVALSGPTYATGPQSGSKRIEWFTDVDTLSGGKLTTSPMTLLQYNGTGQASVSALAAGPDGLYFADLYRDDGVGGATATGANVYRIRYVDFHPTGVTATPADGRVGLSWTFDPLATSHNIYRRVGNGAPVRIASGVTDPMFDDTTALNGTQYHYFVRSTNAGGESNDSNEVAATPAAAPANQPPTIATAAAATPPSVNGTSVALSVLGADDGGESNLTYTWALQGTPQGGLTFSANGTNAAKNTTATFVGAGAYTFVVTVRDAAGNAAQSSVAVTVNQTATAVAVSPASATVDADGTRQFTATATDQFGTALAPQPALTWGVDAGGVGTIDASGLYRAPASGGGTAVVRATAGSLSGAAPVLVSLVAPGTGNGLAAVYFSQVGLAGPSVVRTDATVDFDFGLASPDPFIPVDAFSARWVGSVEPRFSETYTFAVTSDDGVRLWVNGALLVDQLNDHFATRYTGTIALEATQRYPIQLEYYEDYGQALVKLEWESASQAPEVVPQERLYSGAPIKVNFQPLLARGKPPAPAPVPAGYLADNGAVFADRGNGYAYGWSLPNSRGGADRNRTWSPDQRYDTLLRLRKAAWEVAVPNGAYRVHVVSGDAISARGVRRANVEGTPVVNGVATKAQRWVEGWADVVVADGRLTVTNGPRTKGNRINFIDILPLDSVSGAIPGFSSASASNRSAPAATVIPPREPLAPSVAEWPAPSPLMDDLLPAKTDRSWFE